MPTNTDLPGPADLTPPTLAASQNDWGPDQSGGASTWYITASQAVNITGIAGATTGRRLRLVVTTSSSTITLVSASSSSLAANRMALGSNVALAAGTTIALFCPATGSGWVLAEARPGAIVTLTAKSADYTTTDADFGCYLRFTAGTPTLHSPAAGFVGQSIVIRNATGSTLTVGSGTATVTGSRQIATDKVLVAVCTGAGTFDAVGGA